MWWVGEEDGFGVVEFAGDGLVGGVGERVGEVDYSELIAAEGVIGEDVEVCEGEGERHCGFGFLSRRGKNWRLEKK